MSKVATKIYTSTSAEAWRMSIFWAINHKHNVPFQQKLPRTCNIYQPIRASLVDGQNLVLYISIYTIVYKDSFLDNPRFSAARLYTGHLYSLSYILIVSYNYHSTAIFPTAIFSTMTFQMYLATDETIQLGQGISNVSSNWWYNIAIFPTVTFQMYLVTDETK